MDVWLLPSIGESQAKTSEDVIDIRFMVQGLGFREMNYMGLGV